MMANSEAQNIVICELCDNSNSVRWSCVNCLENLCDSCKIVHQRGKLTKHHEVVSKRDYYRLQGTKRLESQCEFHNDICTFYCPGCNDILCTKCVTENHSGHALQKIEIVHQERHKTISDTVQEIQNLQLSDLSDRRRSITSIREEYKKDKHSLRAQVLTQTAQIESIITSYSKSLLDKIDTFYDGDEMRLSQTCDAIEELHVALGKQYEDAENLLNSNDTRRFIGVENSNIMKAVQSVAQYNTPCNIKRPSFSRKTKIDFPQIDTLYGTLHVPSFDFPDQQSGSIQLKYIFEFDKIDQYEIISPLDLSNVWVRDKQTGDVCMWRRDPENQDIERQESGRELITINERTNSIQAISQNGAVREIRHYLFWQPTCIHVAGDIITVGLVDNRMDFEADTVRFGQSLKSPRRLCDFLLARK
jgi:tripartite motif-containing protein 56